MKNRSFAILTLASFLVFSCSCFYHSIEEIKPEVLAKAKPGEYEIRKLEKTTGEVIEYPDDAPGRIGAGQISGTGTLKIGLKSVEVDSGGLEIAAKPGSPLMTAKTRDGRTIEGIRTIEKREDRTILQILIADGRRLISAPIPFADIQRAWVQFLKSNEFVLAAFLGLVVLVILFPNRGFGPSFGSHF